MELEKVLSDLGLSKNEVKVYIALSKLKEATANKIADKSKVHRTNVYDTLERLIKKGLVSYIYIKGTKYFRITNPNNLVNMLENKKKQLAKVLPQLKLTEKLSPTKNFAEVVEGVKGFYNILENFLEYNNEILVYGIPKEAPKLMKNFISGFHKRRLPKKIVMKHIYNHNAQKRIKYLNTLKLTEARFLPEEFDSKVSTNICGDEVVFTLWHDNIMSIRVKNKEIAESYKKYFYVLWEKAKEK